MEAQEWWKEDFEKKHWGAMFECGDYEALLDDVSAIIAEAIRRRDAELLEKVGKMKKEAYRKQVSHFKNKRYAETDMAIGEVRGLGEIIQLIKGE